MDVRHLSVEVRLEGGIAVLDLVGEINGFAEEAMNAAYAEAEAHDPKTILLNFEGVDYINSTGIALIVGLLAKARAAHRSLLACNLSEHYVEIFNITRLSDFMSVFPTNRPLWWRRRDPEMEDEPLDGSLHYLRGEYEHTREAHGTRRNEMPEAQVKMSVRQAGDSASIIDVEGELTAFAEAVLMDAYNQASDGQARAIILNFEDLEYMNSSGIGLLVTLLIRINREKQRLLTYGLSEHYRSIFQITRLDDAIAIHDSEEEAVRAANSA